MQSNVKRRQGQEARSLTESSVIIDSYFEMKKKTKKKKWGNHLIIILSIII